MRSVFSTFVIASVCLYTLQDVAAQATPQSTAQMGGATSQYQGNGGTSSYQSNVQGQNNGQSMGQGDQYQNNGQSMGQGGQYQGQSATSDPYSTSGQPTMVPMQCTQGYMPITEDELMAMSNDAQNQGDPSLAGSNTGNVGTASNAGNGGPSSTGYGTASNTGYGTGPTTANGGGSTQQLSSRSLPNPTSQGTSLGMGGGSQNGNSQTGQYTGTQNPGSQYSNSQTSGAQYGDNQYSNNQNSGAQYGGNQYSNNQNSGAQYGNGQYGNTQSPAIPEQAICAGNDDASSGLCDTSSCTGAVTCNKCQQLIITDANSPTQTNPNVVQQVNCVGNYFKAGPNDPDQSSMCTDANQNMYTCSGGCTGQMSCQSCISRDDPALGGDSGQTTNQAGGVQNGNYPSQSGVVQNGNTGPVGSGQSGMVQSPITQNSAQSQNGYDQTATQTGAQTGTQNAAQTGTQNAAQTGTQNAAQTGTQTAAQTGTQTKGGDGVVDPNTGLPIIN